MVKKAMTDSEQLAFVRDVLTIIEDGSDYCIDGAVWWRTDGEYAPVTFFVNCNDLFYWACADSEELTPENLPDLKQSVADVRVALGLPPGAYHRYPHGGTVEEGKSWGEGHNKWFEAGSHGATLFCARQRKMRPQQPCYELFPDALKTMFDACGPVRDRKDEG